MADRIKLARTVAIVLRAASLLSAGTSASAETFEERQACTGDAFQFCSSEIPNRDRVFSCFAASKDVISAACRSLRPMRRWTKHRRGSCRATRAPTNRRSIARRTEGGSHACPDLSILPHQHRTVSARHLSRHRLSIDAQLGAGEVGLQLALRRCAKTVGMHVALCRRELGKLSNPPRGALPENGALRDLPCLVR